MKVTVPKDFGNNASKKPLLPLVPESTEIAKKEDLAQLELFSNPADSGSAKVRFAFKKLEGPSDSPREIIQWRKNVNHAFVGLNQTAGNTQNNMIQQFARGTALSTYNNRITTLFNTAKANDIADAQKAINDDDGTDAQVLADLNVALTQAQAKTKEAYLTDVGDGTYMVEQALNHMVTSLLPNKILQRVKRYLRREARKPADMNVKTYYMHVNRINSEEIPECPPNFNQSQCLADDEIVDILLYGTPKSWQRDMDKQGFDPLLKTPQEVVDFMERIEMSEDFDQKATKVTSTKSNNKKKANSNANKAADNNGSYYCMLHGSNNTHATDDCNALQADVKKRKANDGNSKPKGKGKNKSWTKKAAESTVEESKQELAALVKKVQKLGKKLELNAVEPVKKRKVNYPSSDEEEEAEFDFDDAELKNFNYGDLEKMTIKEDGELSVSDEVSV
jgi:hypothetical protein